MWKAVSFANQDITKTYRPTSKLGNQTQKEVRTLKRFYDIALKEKLKKNRLAETVLSGVF